MRTIKFRGKDIVNGHWIYGDLIQYFLTNEFFIQATDIENKSYKKIQVDENTIGENTTFKDNNKIEIYEGNIVEIAIPSYYGINKPIIKRNLINYSESKGSFVVSNWGNNPHNVSLDSFAPQVIIKIIGNLHDNPTDLTEV